MWGLSSAMINYLLVSTLQKIMVLAWIEPQSIGSSLAQRVLSYFCLLIRILRQALQDCSVHGTTRGVLCKERPWCLENVLWHLASILTVYVWVSSRTKVSNTYFWSAQPVFQAVLGGNCSNGSNSLWGKGLKHTARGTLFWGVTRHSTIHFHALVLACTRECNRQVPFRWIHWHQQER